MILSIFIPIAGLICSVVGFLRAKEFGDRDKGCALVGIIIGIILTVVIIITIVMYLPVFIEILDLIKDRLLQ